MKRATVGCNNEIFSSSEETLPQSMVSSVFPESVKTWDSTGKLEQVSILLESVT